MELSHDATLHSVPSLNGDVSDSNANITATDIQDACQRQLKIDPLGLLKIDPPDDQCDLTKLPRHHPFCDPGIVSTGLPDAFP